MTSDSGWSTKAPRRRGSCLIETSSTEQYARTRRFYQWHGYSQEATVREYYGTGDDEVIFWKEIAE